jgi:hypothetical protein
VEYAMAMAANVKLIKGCTPRGMDQVITNHTFVLSIFMSCMLEKFNNG